MRYLSVLGCLGLCSCLLPVSASQWYFVRLSRWLFLLDVCLCWRVILVQVAFVVFRAAIFPR